MRELVFMSELCSTQWPRPCEHKPKFPFWLVNYETEPSLPTLYKPLYKNVTFCSKDVRT
uniref:SJCHGC02514 protein n=1 Tax=Schistosoma japonicum TaxID=6182 RepID=Q5BT75_SCHJA|nr:SJCHGC02514 protein [Schistosoma japonicum]